jgi:hypothetical protein
VLELADQLGASLGFQVLQKDAQTIDGRLAFPGHSGTIPHKKRRTLIALPGLRTR